MLTTASRKYVIRPASNDRVAKPSPCTREARGLSWDHDEKFKFMHDAESAPMSAVFHLFAIFVKVVEPVS